MSEDQKKQLEQQLCNIANMLRGKMNADEFRDYILGFIFYKYLSEQMNIPMIRTAVKSSTSTLEITTGCTAASTARRTTRTFTIITRAFPNG